jgi:hypothetical protein
MAARTTRGYQDIDSPEDYLLGLDYLVPFFICNRI